MDRTHLTVLWRTLRDRVDELHPAALAALVGVLLGLAFGAGLVLEPALVAVAIAAAALTKAAVVLAAAGLLARCAVRLAFHHFTRPRPGTVRGYSA
ncbi:hypothetical protein [Streptomyces sp. NPDC014733]|uniref:hypothetical protein n=1 Tax=Streptomyces sp. NPDC014733 TaxID=3364885 RepID=UPI003700BC55